MLREFNGVLAYAILYTLGMTTHMLIAMWLCRRNEIPIRNGIALGLCYIFSMNTGARILYDILHSRFNFFNYFDPGYYMEPGMWGGPMVYLAIATTGILILANDKRRMLDIVALTLPIPMIFAKFACFANACCYGALCSMPWAVTFPEGGTERTAPAGVPLHPTQLYEVFVLIVIAIVFIKLDRKRWKGTLLAWFLMLYGIGRPVAEFFRDPEKLNAIIGPLTLSQVVCFAVAIVSGLVIIAKKISKSQGFQSNQDTK